MGRPGRRRRHGRVSSGGGTRWRVWRSSSSAHDRDRNILWAVGGGAALIGAVLGTMLFMEINRHAPDDWGWSADWAAWLMQANTLQAGYQLIDRNNPGLAAAVNEDIRLGNAYADALHKCEAEAARTGKAERCTVDVQPSRHSSGPPTGR